MLDSQLSSLKNLTTAEVLASIAISIAFGSANQ